MPFFSQSYYLRRMFKLVINFINLVLHIPFIALIYYFWKPISEWYLSRVPALGVDLYLSVTYVSYQARNLSLPFNSFKDFWFAGYPLMGDYPQLTFYLMRPFVEKFGPVVGVQRFTMFALLFFVVSCYLLFYRLARNHGIAILLSVLVLLSPNIYGSATWAGSIPYFFSQSFFPIGLLAGVFYLEQPKIKYLALAALITGAGFMVNGLGIIAFLIPSMFLIIVLGGVINRLPVKKVIGSFFFYNFSWIFVSFSVTYGSFFGLISNFSIPSLAIGGEAGSGASAASAAGSSAIADFYKSQIGLLYDRTDQLIFVAAGIGAVLFLISAIFTRSRRKLLLILPVILIAAWTWAHPVINFSGIFNILRHDPYRAFWQFSVGAGALAAFLIGFFVRAVEQRLEGKSYFIISFLLVNVAIGAGVALYAYTIFNQRVGGTIKVVDANSEYSSAFPESLGIRYKKDDETQLKKELAPSFMDPNDRNTRLYSADATVNIWWHTLFDMPMSRGYIDPPIGTQSRGGIFWLDIAIANDSLTRDFKLSEDIALNNALFLIDWNAIGFFEGGRLSSKGPSPGPSSYLIKNKVFDKDEMVTTHGAIIKYQTASGKPELVPDLPQYLHFYKVADKFRSPVISGNNSSVIGLFATTSGYEDFQRLIAVKNLNSKNLITTLSGINGGYIDGMSLAELKNFDAIYLNGYTMRSRTKSFDLLTNYVKDGGKVFIDTGAEVKESNSDDLPEIFPFKSSSRKGLGREWELLGSGDIVRDVDLKKFGPLVFNDSEWKLTVPKDSNLRDGSEVILTHKGMPVLVERQLGKGKVIWSGMNLAYHYNQYKNDEEAKLFINILSQLVSLSENQIEGGKAVWDRPENVSLELAARPRGILFKEQAYKGWEVKVNGKKLPIFRTGPTYPGFIYVPLSGIDSGSVKVDFKYRGTREYYFVAIVNGLAVLLLLDMFLINGFVSRKVLVLVKVIIGKKVGKWWAKEEE